jgi:hypothetical protein
MDNMHPKAAKRVSSWISPYRRNATQSKGGGEKNEKKPPPPVQKVVLQPSSICRLVI